MHDIRYDAVHDEILVPNQFGQTILTFRGGATGEEAPIRIIQGSRTQLKRPDRLDVDPINNEIFVPNRDSVLVFPREANGNVAPIRVIRGPATQLRNANSVAVDPVNDVVVVGLNKLTEYGGGRGSGALLIFNRTDNGNVQPRGIIRGPATEISIVEQIQVYPPRGWIIIPQSTDWAAATPEGAFIGVWSIRDHGDIPARWKIGGPQSTIERPRGVALNPRTKEIIVADMRLNSVLTYYFPEIF